MKYIFRFFSALIFIIVLIPVLKVQAQNPGCNITSFTLSPNNTTVNLGDVIALEGKSTCGTVRFEIDQEPKSEIGTTGQSMNMNTAEFGVGTHDVCFVAEGEGGWANADRRCVKITVKDNQPQCQITSFSYSPRKDVYTLGDEINFDGKSTCGTTRYTVEGKIVSELGSTDLSYQFKTGEWGKETYTVCFVAHGDGGWEKAVSKCGTIFVGTDPGLPPVYPDDKEPEPEPEGGDNCTVKSLSVVPQAANPGDTITMRGTGDCDGGPKAVKFTVDGQPKGELGAPSLETTWNTSGYSNGTHKVCFLVVKTDWSKAASQCVNVNLGKVAQQPAASCKGDHMTLVKDLTIPDGTKVLPGQVFVKSWRIKNDGNCVWNKYYFFTSLGGEKMEGKVNNIPGTVSPGETIDISLELHAPTEPGTYKSYWGIIDPKENQLKNRVFVLIEVVNSIQTGEKPGEDTPREKRSLDILGYCQSRGFESAFANDKDNARSWVCQRKGEQTFVDFDEACKFSNGDEFGKAVIQNEQNPNSWYCEKIIIPATPTSTQQNPDSKPTSVLTNNGDIDLNNLGDVCSGEESRIIPVLQNIKQFEEWKSIEEKAKSREISFKFCGSILIPSIQNYENPTIIPVVPANKVGVAQAGFKTENKIIEFYFNNWMDNFSIKNSSKDSSRWFTYLAHEMQHVFEDFDSGSIREANEQTCSIESLKKAINEWFYDELKSYAESEGLANQREYDLNNLEDRNYLARKIIPKGPRWFTDVFSSYAKDWENHITNVCNEFLNGKKPYIQYNDKDGVLVIDFN